MFDVLNSVFLSVDAALRTERRIQFVDKDIENMAKGKECLFFNVCFIFIYVCCVFAIYIILYI